MDKLPDRIRIKDIARLADVSVGTVDRVIHNRPGVSPASKERVEKILKELDYQPNMYASALASNKKYHFCAMLPVHKEGSYWCDIEKGLYQAVKTYNDFHISITQLNYDPYNVQTFKECSRQLLEQNPDGVVLAPTLPDETASLVDALNEAGVPFIFVDSNLPDLNPLAFYGQNSLRSGYFAGTMLMLLARDEEELVIFRHVHGGRVQLMNQQQNRERGFRQYMSEYYPHVKILEMDVDVSLSSDEVEALLDRFFLENPTVKSGLTFNSQVGVFGEYVSHHLPDFKLLGYDLLGRNVRYLREGSVRFLIAQQPEMQGYNSIDGLCRHLILKKEIKQLNYMPIDLLTADNVGYYIEAHEL